MTNNIIVDLSMDFSITIVISVTVYFQNEYNHRRTIQSSEKQLRQNQKTPHLFHKHSKIKLIKVGHIIWNFPCDVSNLFYRHFPAYVKGELNITELARVCDMSRTTVYKYIRVLK